MSSILKTGEYPIHRARLQELFGQIEKEFEALWEENQERMCVYYYYYYLNIVCHEVTIFIFFVLLNVLERPFFLHTNMCH